MAPGHPAPDQPASTSRDSTSGAGANTSATRVLGRGVLRAAVMGRG